MKSKCLAILTITALLLTGCSSEPKITDTSFFNSDTDVPTEITSYDDLVYGFGIDVEGKYVSGSFEASFPFCGYLKEVEYISENDNILTLSGYIQTDYLTSTQPHKVDYVMIDGYPDRAKLVEGEKVFIEPIYPLTEEIILSSGLVGTITTPIDSQVGKYTLIKGYDKERIELNTENVVSVELSCENFLDDFYYIGDTIFNLADGRQVVGSICFDYIPLSSDIDLDNDSRLAKGITWIPANHIENREVSIRCVE